MANKLNPYLTFGGNAREAMNFYQAAFGGKLTLQTYKEMNPESAPELQDLIMHGQPITTDGDMTLMGSYDPENAKTYSTSIAVSGHDEATLRGFWDKLSDGEEILAPFETAPWGDTFGMLTDKFGIRWMINVVKPTA